MTVTKTMFEEILKNTAINREEAANLVISPDKKLQPQKGVHIDGIHVTSEGCWSKITFPRWVVVEGSTIESQTKTYRFRCSENGSFLSW